MFPNCHLRLNLCLHFLVFDAGFFFSHPQPYQRRGRCALLFTEGLVSETHRHTQTQSCPQFNSGFRGSRCTWKHRLSLRSWSKTSLACVEKLLVRSESSRSSHSANKQHCKESNERQQLLRPHEYKKEGEEEDGSQAAANQITLVAQCFGCTEGIPPSALPHWDFQLFRTIVARLRSCFNQSFKFNPASKADRTLHQ